MNGTPSAPDTTVPCIASDRTGRVEHMKSSLRNDRLRIAATASVGMDIWRHLVSSVWNTLPALCYGFKELEIALWVSAQQMFTRVRRRRF